MTISFALFFLRNMAQHKRSFNPILFKLYKLQFYAQLHDFAKHNNQICTVYKYYYYNVMSFCKQFEISVNEQLATYNVRRTQWTNIQTLGYSLWSFNLWCWGSNYRRNLLFNIESCRNSQFISTDRLLFQELKKNINQSRTSVLA